jgi:gliding motility-associated-like protein
VSRAENILPEIYTVVGTAVNGCTSIATTYVLTTDLPIPVLKVKPGQHVCVNSTLTLEGGGGVAYEWKLPDQLIYRGAKITVLMKGMEMAGEYTLTVTDKEGCTNFTMTTITLDPAPNGILNASQWNACVPFCADYSFEPYGFSGDVVSTWTLDKKSLGSGKFSKCFSREGTYLFTGALRDTVTGCVNTLTYAVSALAKPQSSFTWDPEKPVETFDEVRFTNTSTGQAQHKWTWYLEGQEPVHTEHMTRTFPEAGNYRIAYVVENQFGCSDTTVKLIEIAPDFHLYVPDAFTPNADGINESFKPVGRGIAKYTMEVYNRWGERVFLSHSLNDGWDGYYQGNLCPSQSFVWKVIVTTTQGELKEFSGHVVLVR